MSSCSRFTSVFALLFSLDMVNLGTEKCTIEAEDTSVEPGVRINFVIRVSRVSLFLAVLYLQVKSVC